MEGESTASSMPQTSTRPSARVHTEDRTNTYNMPPPGFEQRQQPSRMYTGGQYQGETSRQPPVVTPTFMAALEELMSFRESLKNQGYTYPPPPPPPPRQGPSAPSGTRSQTHTHPPPPPGQYMQGQAREEPQAGEREHYPPHHQATFGEERAHGHHGGIPPPNASWRQDNSACHQGNAFQQPQQFGNTYYQPPPMQHNTVPEGNTGLPAKEDNTPLIAMTSKDLEALIDKRMKEKKLKGMHALADNASHPLTEELINTQIPGPLNAIRIDKYMGRGDPIEHIQQHEGSLIGRTSDDRHVAVIFVSTLAGPAAHWFFSLPQGSVTSWADMKAKFIQRYMGERQLLKGSRALDDVQQQHNETLADYYTRFNQNVAEIQGKMTEGEIVRAFVRNLGRLGAAMADKMSQKEVDTLEELAAQVKKFVDLEKHRFGVKAKLSAMQSNNKPQQQKQPQPKQYQGITNWQQQNQNEFRRAREVNLANLIPLNAQPEVILKEMKENNLWKAPTSWQKGPLGKEKDKWCNNHEVTGHDTNDCWSLKFQINNAIQRGELQHYVDQGGKRPREEGQNNKSKGKEKVGDQPPPNKKGTIHVIHGGQAAGGQVSNERDVYVLQGESMTKWGKRPRKEDEDFVISFSRKDLEHIVYPHDDALVITMEIDGYDVKRMLIDGGSSTDLLHEGVLRQLGKARRDLTPGQFPLVSFAGAATYPLGSIVLPVTIGKGWNEKRLNINFVVVETLGAYNGIIGRTTINPHEMVPSTVHQKMKYPTANGVGEVLGDQMAARKCYVNALRRKAQYQEYIKMPLPPVENKAPRKKGVKEVQEPSAEEEALVPPMTSKMPNANDNTGNAQGSERATTSAALA